MIEARLPIGRGLRLIGAVRGLVADAAALAARLDADPPTGIGLSTSPDELAGLREHFGPTPAEPLVPLAPTESAEIRALARYGEVRVPNPAFLAALAWGATRAVPVEALDPTDDRFAELFTDHIGYLELVRRTVRERGLLRRPPTPATADEFAILWDGTINRSSGSVALAAARNAELVQGARALADAGTGPVAIVVDRERFGPVAEALGGGAVPGPPA